jgi:hypothetical protein
MRGCCGGVGVEFRKKQSLFSMIAYVMIRARVPEGSKRAGEIYKDRLEKAIEGKPESVAREIRTCQCPCHTEGAAFFC